MVIDDVLYVAALWLLVGAAAAWYFCRAAQRLRQPQPSRLERQALTDSRRAEPRRHEPGIPDVATLLHAMRVDERS
jgi:hypothetical protein